MKKLNESLRFIGRVDLDLFSPDGKLISHQRVDNLIVTVGKAHLAGLANGVVTTPFKYIALGGTNTAAAAGDTALVSEITTGGMERKLGSVDRITTTVANDTARIIASFTNGSGATVTIYEAGLFNATSAGVICSRVVPTPVAVLNTNTLQVTWTLKAA